MNPEDATFDELLEVHQIALAMMGRHIYDMLQDNPGQCAMKMDTLVQDLKRWLALAREGRAVALQNIEGEQAEFINDIMQEIQDIPTATRAS